MAMVDANAKRGHAVPLYFFHKKGAQLEAIPGKSFFAFVKYGILKARQFFRTPTLTARTNV